MARLACVEIPALPLQLLLTREPDWIPHPAAVLDRDTPQGLILWVNERGWKSALRPGMRHADALSLCPDLRAGAITDETVGKGVERLIRRLQQFSPEVEPSEDFTGAFWLNVAGLTPLYPSLDDWAHAVAADLEGGGFRSRIVIGYTRFGTYAVARNARMTSARTPVLVKLFEDQYSESRAAHEVPLERLELEPRLREMLAKLGVRTVGTFLRLPASSLRQRFGEHAHRLRRLAGNDLQAPLSACAPEETLEAKACLDEAITSVFHVLAVVKRLLAPILERLAGRGRAVSTLHILLALDTRDNRIESVRPATATLDVAILLDLLQLRLHGGRLPAGVVEIELRVETAEAEREQLRLFNAGSRRDLKAGARAMARIRAELGEDSLVRAQLREGHLPEAGFTWEPAADLPRAHARKLQVRTLVRRIYSRPVPLPRRPASERNDNWLMQELEFGPVVRSMGPYVISGGWWATTVHREYYFVETRRGDLLWTYYDGRRRRWFLHGRVE
jgi:protein ImuB